MEGALHDEERSGRAGSCPIPGSVDVRVSAWSRILDVAISSGVTDRSLDAFVISSVQTRTFTYPTSTAADPEGHTHPGPTREVSNVVLRIATQGGAEGFGFGMNHPATS